MKSRMNIILVAILVMLGAIILILVRGQRTTVLNPAALRIELQTVSPLLASTGDTVPAPVFAPVITQTPAIPTDKPVTGEKAGYTAADGDTLSNVVIGLMGSDTKLNRAEVVAANPALQADPDRVLAGKTYFLAGPGPHSVAVAPTAEVKAVAAPVTSPEVSEAPHGSSDRKLKYVAQPGDSVSILAAGLLGADSKTNRDAIIASNQSLKQDPDVVIAGKTYTIPTSSGLSSAPTSASHQPSPATQPATDADDIVRNAAGRSLRYTARAGDNVSKLATVLLGSDTKVNRDAIINSNPTLKTDPDRVVAGQSYWIPAPPAVVAKP